MYCPLMAFQKTSTSGRIVNTNSNTWGHLYGMGLATYPPPPNGPCSQQLLAPDPQIVAITKNMIDVLLSGTDIFVSPAPTSFSIKPSSTTVSYSACMSGSIHITPGGVNIINGYKVDNYDGSTFAKIEDCTSCNSNAKMASTTTYTPPINALEGKAVSVNSNYPLENDSKNLIQIFPNPTSGLITINQLEQFTGGNMELINLMGKIVVAQKINEATVSLYLTGLPKGIYLLKVANGNVVVTKKIVYQ